METKNNNQTVAPSWGAPASKPAAKNIQPQDVNIQQNPFRNDQSYHHGRSPISHPYQRPSSYRSDQNRGRGASMDSSFQNSRKQNDSPSFQNHNQSFSPRNPFVNQGQNFSSDNPFQNKGHNFSPRNPFQNKGQFSSPNPHTQLRPNFHSSPKTHTPGMTNQSFSPRTPDAFYTPSPRGFGYHRGNSDSSRQFGQRHNGFGQRHNGMNNPGGSNNIKDYINPSMLEDPWKDLPPTPMLQSY